MRSYVLNEIAAGVDFGWRRSDRPLVLMAFMYSHRVVLNVLLPLVCARIKPYRRLPAWRIPRFGKKLTCRGIDIIKTVLFEKGNKTNV